MDRRSFRRCLGLLAAAPLVFFLGFALHTLLREPCVGVADIMDFWRVTDPAGIEHVGPLENPGYYVRCDFRTTESRLTSAPSSSALLAWSAKQLAWGSSRREGRFDLRQVGLLYLAILAATVAAGLARGFPPLLSLFIGYVIVDPGYLLFFNSFYADATLFVALIGTVVWLERLETSPRLDGRPLRGSWLAAIVPLVLFAFLGGASKMQYVLFPAVMIPAILVPFLARIREMPRRLVTLAAALAVVFLAGWWNFFLGPGPRFLEFNNYHAVYGGILRVASEPQEVLEDLGLPREYWDLPRKDAWSAKIGVDHPVHRHLRDVSRLKLLKYYVLDGSARSAVLTEVARELARVRSHPRGNHVREERDRRPVQRTFQVPWQYSKLSRLFLASWPPIVWLVVLGCTAWVLARAWFRGWSGIRTASLFLLLWFATQVVVVVVGEGLVNAHQHLVGARLGLDLLLLFVLADIVSSVYGKLVTESEPGAPAGPVRGNSGGGSQSPLEERARRFLNEQLAAERPPDGHRLSRVEPPWPNRRRAPSPDRS